MRHPPPGLTRPNPGCVSFDLESYFRRLFTALRYDISDSSKVGEPGEYTGTARCGGLTYQFALDYFAGEVMSKFNDKKPSSDEAKTLSALSRFDEAETLCAATNARFSKYLMGHRPANEQVTRVMLRAREKIGALMAKVDWSRVHSGSTFTSGGSVLLPRSKGTPIHKYSTSVEATVQSFNFVSDVFHPIHASGGSADDPEILLVQGNKLTCVDKNYKTHRIIAGEPSGSMYLQKGLHKEIRKLLRSVGVDLSSQLQNQEWALFGSATGLVATVDMSMASDTVAKLMVEWFYSLNPEVLLFMEMLRSTTGGFASGPRKGERVTYQKFSSMGNALTFEIETTIFWALATSVCDVLKADRRFVSVYGDDVIIPNRCVPLFFDVLKECGFVPNEKKTFYELNSHSHAHRFRESCGKHFYRGEDVTPVYVRAPIENQIDRFKLINNLVRWVKRLERISDAPDLSSVWKLIGELRAENAPCAWTKPRIPDGFGDGAFIGTFDECTPSVIKGKNHLYAEGYRIEVLSERLVQAVGRAENGNAIVINRKGKRVEFEPPKTLSKAEQKQFNRQLSGVTLRGYALASLERLERTRATWHEYTRRLPPKLLAIVLAERDLPTEAATLPLAKTKQVVTSQLRLKPGVSW